MSVSVRMLPGYTRVTFVSLTKGYYPWQFGVVRGYKWLNIFHLPHYIFIIDVPWLIHSNFFGKHFTEINLSVSGGVVDVSDSGWKYKNVRIWWMIRLRLMKVVVIDLESLCHQSIYWSSRGRGRNLITIKRLASPTLPDSSCSDLLPFAQLHPHSNLLNKSSRKSCGMRRDLNHLT